MTGRIVHFEIPFDDAQRAKDFYSGLFGWDLQQMPEEFGGYVMVSTGPSGEQGPTEPGFINGGMWKRDEPSDSPRVVIDVPDIDATLRDVESRGGKALSPRQPVGEMGFAAYFADPEGNVVGLWETAQP